MNAKSKTQSLVSKVLSPKSRRERTTSKVQASRSKVQGSSFCSPSPCRFRVSLVVPVRRVRFAPAGHRLHRTPASQRRSVKPSEPPAKSIDSDFSKGYQTPTRSHDMKRHLLWILPVVLAAVVLPFVVHPRSHAENFERLMGSGRGSFEKGDFTNEVRYYRQAVKLAPESLDAHLNLANASLLIGQSESAVGECQRAIDLDQNDPAAYYVMGCAYLRQNQAEKAVQAFQQSQKIDPSVDALSFQLGLAQERAGHPADAIQQFETLLQFQPDHPSAHYQLSRLYQRTDRAADAAAELAKHQALQARNPGVSLNPIALERCKYTQPRVAFSLAQPDRRGT